MFAGPLFIVGMPRSGTKLLRALLNGHSRISISDVETGFLPYLVAFSDRFPNLSERSVFNRFYERVTRLPYFIYRDESGCRVSESQWYSSCKAFSPEGVFEALLRLETGCPWGSDRVWGDKSPSYIRHLSLIKKLYSTAKVVHIVRDVRDYCLSVNKAWGKDIYRAAERWNEGILSARVSAAVFPGDYLEVRYEDLVKNPEVIMRSACQFLGLPYEERMLSLDRPTENIGDAVGEARVVASNTDKYITRMDERIRAKVEALAFAGMIEYGYSFTGRRVPSVLGRLERQIRFLGDGLALLRFEMRKSGLTKGLRKLVGFRRSRIRVNELK